MGIVPNTPNVNVIWSMWIFTHKEKSINSFDRHKSWLLGDNASQHVGIDCGDAFIPIDKPETTRYVLSLTLS